jgi:hypothetical protein
MPPSASTAVLTGDVLYSQGEYEEKKLLHRNLLVILTLSFIDEEAAGGV